jgi:hypothetical protein
VEDRACFQAQRHPTPWLFALGSLEGQKKVRRLRVLAQVYEIQKQEVQTLIEQKNDLMDSLLAPPLPGGVPQGMDPARLLANHESLAKAKYRLLNSWVDYHVVHLAFRETLEAGK